MKEKKSITISKKKPISLHSDISFTFYQTLSHSFLIDIQISETIVNKLLNIAAQALQKHVKAPGFNFGGAPLSFIKKNYETTLTNHLKELLFKYYVINYLYKMIRTHKKVVVNEPKLEKIIVQPGKKALFTFKCFTPQNVLIHEWRYFPFKAPKRKNYKDLDRQVESFITAEQEAQENYNTDIIQPNDWIALQITIVNPDKKPLINDFSQIFWLCISNEKVDNPLRDLFCNKRVNDSWITQNNGLQEYFSEQLSTNYYFHVKILEHVPHAYFCFEQFKKHFRIKTKKDLYKKLIEVFSYRNDLSQRRTMTEDCLKLLLTKYPFSVSEQIIHIYKEALIASIKDNSDYNVYRTQKNFTDLIQKLAIKQASEDTILDTLAYYEKITLTREDIKTYLNLTKRNRTKEFIYCKLPLSLHEGQTTLIPEEEIKRYCLREKTINHAIFHLTRE